MIINPNIRPGAGLADPHAFVEDGKVYIFCGHDQSAKTEDTWRMDKWCIFSSEDLVTWKEEGEILPTQTYIGDKPNCWAGYITKKEDTYYWYFSNKNIDTGVVCANTITGPYEDRLGQPVLPEDIAPTRSYDPCVYEEEGKYTLFFGAGHYYCVDLAEDMMSLAGEPEAVHVYNEAGREVNTSDKSTVFKYKDKYYLAYGEYYAMSEHLKGPYRFMGRFVGGGHNDVFEFKGKMYVCNEFHDTNIFFRGIRVMELLFNEDGTIRLDADDELDTQTKKTWDFKNTMSHWFLTDGNDASYTSNGLSCPMSQEVGVRSPLWPGLLMSDACRLEVTLQNTSLAQAMRVEVISIQQRPGYWSDDNHEVFEVIVPLEQHQNRVSYTIEVPISQTSRTYIKRVAIYTQEQELMDKHQASYIIEKITIS